MKGAADYSTGLANNTYTNNANIYRENQNQIGNFLTGQVAQGQNAAAGQGALITGQANQAGQTQAQGATATASGIMGSANAFSGALNNISQMALISQMQAQNGGKTTPNMLTAAKGF